MSIQAVSFVLDSYVPEVAAKMLLVCLANAHNNETGLCCPSVNRLAEESNMSRRSVQRWIKWLDENDFLDVIGTATESGRQQSNQYRLVGFHRGAKLTPLANMGGDTGDTGEGDTRDTLGGDTVGTPLKEPEEYRNKEREQASTRVSFDEILEVFPCRPMMNRSDALAAYNDLTDEESVRVLVAAKRYGRWHIEDATARHETPQAALEYRVGLGKWLRSKAWIEALTLPLKSDPAPATLEGWVYLAADHPDFRAVEKMLGKKLPIVSASGKRGFRIEEIEQARADQ